VSVLSGSDILRLLKATPPLVEGWLDLNEQVQANGFDLTLRDCALVQSRGQIAVDNRDRVVAGLSPLSFDKTGFLDLALGAYMITYNEIVHLPKDVMALGRPRSSLLRCGVSVGTAVWDTGYEGRSQSLLVVHNPLGFRVQKNARITQLVFFTLTGESEGYKGIYQGENI
jgi:dUTP pyrophosphatase